MRSRFLTAVAAAATVGLTAGTVSAASVTVNGGATSVALDTDTLSSAASLDLSSVSNDVISPGAIPGSVAFAINAPDAPSLPTTFMYDPADFLGSFSGSIEHQGSVFFNSDTVEVGDFTIGFDANRAGTLNGLASGFFVASNVGIQAILFDIENPSTLNAASESLQIGANLLVSPEFAGFLTSNSLASVDLSGADVGDAQVNATAIPTPTAAAGILVGLGLMALRRQRQAA